MSYNVVSNKKINTTVIGRLGQNYLSVGLKPNFTREARKRLVAYSAQLVANYPKNFKTNKYNRWLEKRDAIDKMLRILDHIDDERFNLSSEMSDSSVKAFKAALESFKACFLKELSFKLLLPFGATTAYFFKWYPTKLQAALLVEDLEKLLNDAMQIVESAVPPSRNPISW